MRLRGHLLEKLIGNPLSIWPWRLKGHFLKTLQGNPQGSSLGGSEAISSRNKVNLSNAIKRLIKFYEETDDPESTTKWREELELMEPAEKNR